MMCDSESTHRTPRAVTAGDRCRMPRRPRALALLALLRVAQTSSTPNCTQAECAVRASGLGASFEVRATSQTLPAGCLLFEQDDWSYWTHYSRQVMYVRECVGDDCGSDHGDCPCTVCPCTMLDCSGNPTASPTVAPSLAPTARVDTRAPSVAHDAKSRSAMRRWLFPSCLIVLALGPCCVFMASKRSAMKERGGRAVQGGHETELVHRDARGAKYSVLGKEASAGASRGAPLEE